MNSIFENELKKILKNNFEKSLKDDTKNKKIVNEAIKDIKSQKSISTTDLIEKYNFLQKDGNHVNIEKEFSKWLDKNHFEKKGFYFPKSDGKVNSSFANLRTLKRTFIEKEIHSQYRRYKVQNKQCICLFTWVMADGLGDLSLNEELFEIIRTNFSQISVLRVLLLEKNVKVKKCQNLEIVYYDFKKDFESSYPKVSDFNEKILTKIAQTNFILQTPTYYPKTKTLLKKIFKISNKEMKQELLGEYGFIEKKEFSPLEKSKSLGLHPLEKGIILKKIVPKKNNNKILLKILEKDPESASYKKTNSLFFAYVFTERAYYTYIFLVLEFSKNFKKNIDICFPKAFRFANLLKYFEEIDENLKFFKKFGISKVLIYLPEKKITYHVSSKGKVLRIIILKSLEKQDFQNLLRISQEIVGCSGNQSFSEAISLNKVFFYEPKLHAKFFVNSLINLAGSDLKKFPKTIKFLKCFQPFFNLSNDMEFFRKLGIKMAKLLQDKSTFEGFYKLNQIISKNYNANDFIINMIKRKICHIESPKIEKKEILLIDEFLDEKISFKELKESLLSVRT